jgi:hypothetical protein
MTFVQYSYTNLCVSLGTTDIAGSRGHCRLLTKTVGRAG